MSTKKICMVEHLYAGKPQAFGPRQSPSSIMKEPHNVLTVRFDGALEDEQGNKKLHGGPFMALHQFAQPSYQLLSKQFSHAPQAIAVGTIGENISSAKLDEENVFIGDEYQIGNAILQVVSPRAPCAKINHRYGLAKIDAFVAKHGLTGWYYSVLKEGNIATGDDIILVERCREPISVRQIWDLRQLQLRSESPQLSMELATRAFQERALAPEWQAHMHRASIKLAQQAC